MARSLTHDCRIYKDTGMHRHKAFLQINSKNDDSPKKRKKLSTNNQVSLKLSQ